jgi:hypothetical protein
MRLDADFVQNASNAFNLARQFLGAMSDEAVVGGTDHDHFAVHHMYLNAGGIDHFMMLQS